MIASTALACCFTLPPITVVLVDWLGAACAFDRQGSRAKATAANAHDARQVQFIRSAGIVKRPRHLAARLQGAAQRTERT
jgi:hypothetical protein